MTAIFNDLLAAADDLDRLEELDPRPGRVGLSNRLRRAVREADLVAWCDFHKAGGLLGTDCWGAGLDGQDTCRMVRRPLLKSDAAST